MEAASLLLLTARSKSKEQIGSSLEAGPGPKVSILIVGRVEKNGSFQVDPQAEIDASDLVNLAGGLVLDHGKNPRYLVLKRKDGSEITLNTDASHEEFKAKVLPIREGDTFSVPSRLAF